MKKTKAKRTVRANAKIRVSFSLSSFEAERVCMLRNELKISTACAQIIRKYLREED